MVADGEGDDVTEGTYVISIGLRKPVDITVGSLGEIHFDSGGYAYIGSAFGPGGFTRIDRHRAVARGDHDVRHWHIDYLLAEKSVALLDVHRIPGRDRECVLATALGETMIDDFGASDCQCPSHLGYYPDQQTLQKAVVETIQSDRQ